jgi:hypothetical protein
MSNAPTRVTSIPGSPPNTSSVRTMWVQSQIQCLNIQRSSLDTGGLQGWYSDDVFRWVATRRAYRSDSPGIRQQQFPGQPRALPGASPIGNSPFLVLKGRLETVGNGSYDAASTTICRHIFRTSIDTNLFALVQYFTRFTE